jgi:hypothetical protein
MPRIVQRSRFAGDDILVSASSDHFAAHASVVALADRQGHLYVSADTGRSWSERLDGLPLPSGVLIA